MESYSDFASVYDVFMDETPYEEWTQFLLELIARYGISKPKKDHVLLNEEKKQEQELLDSERDLVIDLGCGTGTLTELFAERGYDVIGIDNSQEMLNFAMDKKEKNPSNTLYLCQDMREIDLYSTAGTMVSICDSVNYLLEDTDVEAMFCGVNNYLYPGGIFIFDFNTVYKYRTVIGDTTIAENREECSFIWENFYDEETRMNEYDLTIFVQEENHLFRRFTETHFQRGYTLEEMECFVEKSGLMFVVALDGESHKEPTAQSERIYIVARECQKNGRLYRKSNSGQCTD